MSDRLQQVASQIRASVLVDVGSDHGSLLVRLLRSGRIDRGIAVENKRRPYENSVRSLRGLAAEVRFGNGLDPVRVGEADCLSITGIGARNICRIIKAHPDRVPDTVVFQPSNRAWLLRAWAMETYFRVTEEINGWGRWPYNVLVFQRSKHVGQPDPAYDGLDHEAALTFGPLTISRREKPFVAALQSELAYWQGANCRDPNRRNRIELIHRVIEHSIENQPPRENKNSHA